MKKHLFVFDANYLVGFGTESGILISLILAMYEIVNKAEDELAQTRIICYRGGMSALADAYLSLAQKCSLIFSASKVFSSIALNSIHVVNLVFCWRSNWHRFALLINKFIFFRISIMPGANFQL